jgi:putative membrane protein
MHSVSDHSLNIPSKGEVERYLDGISSQKVLYRGDTCTEPIQVKRGKSTATGIAFGRTAVVLLSLAPHGMEDVPASVKEELESHSRSLGFSDLLVIDCHNAMGRHVIDQDKTSLAESAKQCLDELAKQPQKNFKIGFSSHEGQLGNLLASHELGQSGIATLAIAIGDQKYAIGWADSNNMANSLRDKITSAVGNGFSMLEVCTSDTHSTSGKRTREGYFPLGTTVDNGSIASAFDAVSKKAAEQATDPCAFELARSSSMVKVMGKKQFEDYSTALDRSMNLTKVFLGATAAVYIAMIIFS